MTAEDPMTIGELGRLIKALAAEVREDRRNYLALAVWEVEKRTIEERDRAKGREIAGLRGALEGVEGDKEVAHEKLRAEIQKLRDENITQREQARKDRAKVWVAIGLAVLGGIIAVIGGVATSSLTALINGGVTP